MSKKEYLFKMKQYAIINGLVVLLDKIETGKVILLKQSKIEAISDRNSIDLTNYQVIDAENGYISPGLIDIHTHGAFYHTFNDADKKSYETILKADIKSGVTTIAPTLLAVPIPELINALEFIHEWRNNQKTGMTFLTGAYLESPYIAPDQHGAISASALRTPDDGSIDSLLEFYNDIKVFMIAPELPGSVDAYKKIVKKGIIGSMGHSNAIESEILPCIQAGASHVTHLWSAMSTVTRKGPWRQPGLLEVALTHSELSCEIIADGCHLPGTLMKMALQCKGTGRLCAVSDALNGAGLPEGTHFSAGDMEYEVHDGVGMVLDHSCFAGSTTLLGKMIPILIQKAGLSISDAFRITTETPAKILGENDHIGSLKPGYDADIVIFERNNFSVQKLIQKGNLIDLKNM